MSDYADFVPWDWNVEIPGLTTRDAVRLLLDSRSLGLSEWLGYASSHTHVRWVMNAGGGVAFLLRVFEAAVSGRRAPSRTMQQNATDLAAWAEYWWSQHDPSAPNSDAVVTGLVVQGCWVEVEGLSHDEALLVAGWAQGAGYGSRLLDPASWMVLSESRWEVRWRRALIVRALRSGLLSPRDAARAHGLVGELGRWLARTRWFAVESAVAERLGEVFPRWANRVIAREQGVSVREEPWVDEADAWPAEAWSVVIDGLTREDAAQLDECMDGWPREHREWGSDPRDRHVSFSDVTRVAAEVQLWEAVRRRDVAPSTWYATGRWVRRQHAWLARRAAGRPAEGVGRRVEAPEDAALVYDADWETWIDGQEGLSAERAQVLVEFARERGYAASALDPAEWMPRSAIRDDVKQRRRVAGVALRGRGLSAEEREVARRIRREDGAWLRRTRWFTVRQGILQRVSWLTRRIRCLISGGARAVDRVDP